MPDRRDLDRLNTAQDKAVELAIADLKKIMARLSGATPEQTRDALLQAMPALVSKWGDVAATAAAAWYDQLRAEHPELPPYKAHHATGIDADAVRTTTRRLAGGLWDSGRDQVTAALAGNVGMWLKNRGRETVAKAVDEDPAHPGWARVPRGGTTCAWCTMLASRGFAYKEKATAAASSHRACDCQIVPNFGKDAAKIDGYDPEALYKQYSKARANVVARNGDGHTPTDREITDELRRMSGAQRDSRNREYIEDENAREFFDALDDLDRTAPRRALAARDAYTGSAYGTMNRLLRDNVGSEYDRENVRNLRSLFTTNPSRLDRNRILFRGLSLQDVPEVDSIFNDEGFVSTSLSAKVAEDFAANSEGRHQVIMRIRARTGTLFVPGLDSERELILTPGTRFRVRSRTERPDGIIEMEVEAL